MGRKKKMEKLFIDILQNKIQGENKEVRCTEISRRYYALVLRKKGWIDIMLKKIRKHLKICAIIGFIAFLVSLGIFWYTYNLYVSNHGQIDWPQTLAIGLSSISIGIALISLCISITGGKRIRRLIDSDYENFMNLFENVRIDFIEESTKREGRVDRVNVEVLAWKSRQYFDRAFDLIEWVDESKLRHLSEYLKQL
jgi:hypothetical protein